VCFEKNYHNSGMRCVSCLEDVTLSTQSCYSSSLGFDINNVIYIYNSQLYCTFLLIKGSLQEYYTNNMYKIGSYCLHLKGHHYHYPQHINSISMWMVFSKNITTRKEATAETQLYMEGFIDSWLHRVICE